MSSLKLKSKEPKPQVAIEVDNDKAEIIKKIAKQPLAKLEKLQKAMSNPVYMAMFNNLKI